MSRYSIEEFVNQTAQKDHGQGLFELESARMLEMNLNGTMWLKTGAMIAYRGQVKFTREGIMEHGIGKMFKKALSGEGARLTKAEGTGKVYLADSGKKVTILNLQLLKSLSLWLNSLRQSGVEWTLPFIGSFSLSQLPVQFEPAKYERMVFGLILILMMIFRPQGILPPRKERNS